jgi:hypothetical protein
VNAGAQIRSCQQALALPTAGLSKPIGAPGPQPPRGLIHDVHVAPGQWIMIDQAPALRRAPRPGWGRY